MASHPCLDRWGRGWGQGALYGAHAVSSRREKAVGGLGQGGGSGRSQSLKYVLSTGCGMRWRGSVYAFGNGEEVCMLLA